MHIKHYLVQYRSSSPCKRTPRATHKGSGETSRISFCNGMTGFTLVELSIVLVILGLLVGGVLAGQNLIRAAELRAVVTEVSKTKTIIAAFKEKYFAFPGDMANAYDFWGVAAGCTDVDVNSSSAGCNGNGDGVIGGNGTIATWNDPRFEGYRAWQHLSLAGLTEGSWPGTASVHQYQPVVGTEIPSVLSETTGFALMSITQSSPSGVYVKFGSNLPADGAFAGAGNANKLWGPSMIPEEAWGLDKKLDDGLPSSGTMQGVASTVTTPYRGCTPSGEYNLTVDEPACLMFIKVY